jgi:hypothetical protein
MRLRFRRFASGVLLFSLPTETPVESGFRHGDQATMLARNSQMCRRILEKIFPRGKRYAAGRCALDNSLTTAPTHAITGNHTLSIPACGHLENGILHGFSIRERTTSDAWRPLRLEYKPYMLVTVCWRTNLSPLPAVAGTDSPDQTAVHHGGLRSRRSTAVGPQIAAIEFGRTAMRQEFCSPQATLRHAQSTSWLDRSWATITRVRMITMWSGPLRTSRSWRRANG